MNFPRYNFLPYGVYSVASDGASSLSVYSSNSSSAAFSTQAVPGPQAMPWGGQAVLPLELHLITAEVH